MATYVPHFRLTAGEETDKLNVNEYRELIGSIEESYTGGEARVRRKFLCRWDERWTFALWLVGTNYVNNMIEFVDVVDPVEVDFFISRQAPQAYSQVPRLTIFGVENEQPPDAWMYCTQIEGIRGVRAKNWDATFNIGNYHLAEVTTLWESVPYYIRSDDDPELYGEIPGDVLLYGSLATSYDLVIPGKGNLTNVEYGCRPFRFISKTVQPHVEHLTLGIGRMFYVSNPVKSPPEPTPSGVNKLVGKSEVVYTWHRVPSKINNTASQLSNIQKYLGSVNLYTFDSYPPGTLLLTAVDVQPYRWIGGQYMSDIRLRMTHVNWLDMNGNVTNLGHNYFLHFTTIQIDQPPGQILGYQYDLVTTDGTTHGRRVFEAKDFYFLFQP